MDHYPLFDKEYLILKKNKLNDQFENHLNWAFQVVNNIQNNSKQVNEVPLSFYPIAKNIRFVSSYMVLNLLNNKKSIIKNLIRSGEENFWVNQCQRGTWYPWLWARGIIKKENFSNYEGWINYFNSFNIQDKYIFSDCIPVLEPEKRYKVFYLYLACLKYTFRLNDNQMRFIKNYKTEMKWPEDKKILAVQIRRGETCTVQGHKSDREFFNLDVYIQNIDKLHKIHKYDYIYISTDSDQEIKKLQQKKPEWPLLYLPIDRKKFFRMNDNASKPKNTIFSGVAQDLEDSCRLNPSKIPFIVDSGLADLYFISQCQGYISTIGNSEFSRLGWYLQMSTQKTFMPYINLNSNYLDLSKRDNLLLL